jgi:hypothetical protein
VIVEGYLNLQIVYVADAPGQPVHHMHQRLDFTQFVELEGAEPEMMSRVKVKVEDIQGKVKDRYSARLEVTAVLLVFVKVTELDEVTLMTSPPAGMEAVMEKGFQIIYTRNNKSSNPKLEERVAIANSANADLFLSIHHDASVNKSAHGVSTHYSTYRPELDNEGVYEEYSSTWAGYIKYDATPCAAAAKSIILAEDLVNNIANLGFSNRGKFDHNLYVTRMTTMPSVLIEAGFMSNDEEVLRVSDPKMERAIAQKIVETIVDFFER